MIWTWLTKQAILNNWKEKDNYQVYLLVRRSVFLSPPNGTSVFSVVLGFAGWRSRWFRRCLLFVYNYLLSPHLPRCYSLLRTILFKLYIFRPDHFSFVLCPSVLDDLPPLVAVASSSSCPNLLRGEMHVDFSGSNVDDCFNGAEEQYSKNDGWIVVVFSYDNNLSECLGRPFWSRTVTRVDDLDLLELQWPS